MLLVLSGMLRSQLLPCVGRMRDVLDGAETSGRVLGLEVERAEVDHVISRFIQSMKCDAHEALLLNVLAPDINLDCAVGELDPFQEREAVAGAFAQANAFSGSVAEG